MKQSRVPRYDTLRHCGGHLSTTVELRTGGQTCGNSLLGSAMDPISNSAQNMDGGTRTPMIEMESPPKAQRMTGAGGFSKWPRPMAPTPFPTRRKKLHEGRRDEGATNQISTSTLRPPECVT